MASNVVDEKNQDKHNELAHNEYTKDIGSSSADEPENLSLRDAIRGNGSVMWWSFFFALSAIGW